MAVHLRSPCANASRLLFPDNLNSSNPPPTAFTFGTAAFRGGAVVRAFALKRSPKRLKYSAPRRFTKVDDFREDMSEFVDDHYGMHKLKYFEEGGLLYVEVFPSAEGAENWKLDKVIEILKEGAVGVIPTDTVYAMVCDLNSPSAIERLRRIKDIEDSKPLSILCRSFRDIDTYTMGFPCGDGQGHANIFRAVKHILPGPYTFILTASKELPKQCMRYGTASAKYAHRKNVGVRMPDDVISQAILQRLDAPLISTSVKVPVRNEWMIDPVIIADTYGPEGLDFVVDGGIRIADPSTVVDMTRGYPRVVRQGKGPKLPWMEAEEEVDGSREEDLIAIAT